MRKAGQPKFAIDYFEHYTLLQPNEVEVSNVELGVDFVHVCCFCRALLNAIVLALVLEEFLILVEGYIILYAS